MWNRRTEQLERLLTLLKQQQTQQHQDSLRIIASIDKYTEAYKIANGLRPPDAATAKVRQEPAVTYTDEFKEYQEELVRAAKGETDVEWREKHLEDDSGDANEPLDDSQESFRRWR